MVDVEAVIRKRVADLPAMQAVFGNRVYAGRRLPNGYNPTQGAAALLAVRGGGLSYSSKLISVSVQFRVYAETEAKAKKATMKLFDAVNDTQWPQVKFARMEAGTVPTILTEPETDWAFGVLFVRVWVENS
jgi:hypothetical protein